MSAIRRACVWSSNADMSTGSALTRAFLMGGVIVGGGGRVRSRDKLIG
jgi:hypothetical protein